MFLALQLKKKNQKSFEWLMQSVWFITWLQIKVASNTKQGEFVNFRAILLTRCQKEFEKDKDSEKEMEERRKVIDKTQVYIMAFLWGEIMDEYFTFIYINFSLWTGFQGKRRIRSGISFIWNQGKKAFIGQYQVETFTLMYRYSFYNLPWNCSLFYFVFSLLH